MSMMTDRADFKKFEELMSTTYFLSKPLERRHSVGVAVGDIMVGGQNPIVVQSMTNTDTADVDATVSQVAALWQAGSNWFVLRLIVMKRRQLFQKNTRAIERLGIFCPIGWRFSLYWP